MIIIKSIVLIVMMVILSMVIGRIIVVQLNNNKDSLALAFVCGIMTMMATFLPITLVCTFARASLTMLTAIWSVIVIVLAVYSVKKEGKQLTSLIHDKIKNNKMTIIMAIVLLLILFQICFVVVNWHSDADDATYVGIATTSLYTDTINQFNPLTGASIEVAQFKDYILAPFSIFWAMIAKLFAIHPAIIMHTLLPIILILFHYAVFYLIGRQFFTDTDKIWWFLLFVALINMFGDGAARFTSKFLLCRIWQGKAVLCSTLIPLAIYLIIRAKEKESCVNDWVMLFLCMASACLVSGMGPILMIPLLIGYFIIDFIQNRELKRAMGYIICGVPLYINAGLYLLLGEIG